MRIIMHLDLDAFFAAVEQRDNLELKGKPVVVGANPKEGKGRGVVSTASYEARVFGVSSGMPISKAWRLCAGRCVFLPVNYEKYSQVSSRIMKILSKYADKLEQTSIDEAYLDVSRVGSFEKARGLAIAIKKEILRKEGLTCSIGIAQNKLVAKIASDYKKPDGLTVVPPGKVWDFLAPLNVRKIPGIGPKTAFALSKIKVRTIAELRRVPKDKLIELFGSFGKEMYEYSRGIDESPVVEEWEHKQVSRQFTFEEDTSDEALIFETMNELVKDVYQQILSEKKAFRTVTIKVRYEDFETHTSSRTLIEPTQSFEAMGNVANELLQPFLKRLKEKKLRLIGFGVSNLSLKGQAQR